MDLKRKMILTIFLLITASCSLLFSFPILAASRGITIETRTSSGVVKEIQLYSGYHALVVGCGDYRGGWPRLPNPVKDVHEVASMLTNLGWSVDILENPDGKTLENELNKLITGPGRSREKAILFWFSGHGHTIEEADGSKLGYLVPVDAPDPDRDPLGFMGKAISMRQIETVSKQIMSKHVLMTFDSCFSGAIFQMLRTRPSPYIQEKVFYPVREFITAGSENEQVPDKSVFKDVFIQAISDGFADLNRDNYVTGEELGAYLREKVINYSRKAQHPQFGKINNPKLDKGDFIFHLASSGAVADSPSNLKKPTVLSVKSNVLGASVFVDGLKIGSTPLSGVSIHSGEHSIVVEKAGYNVYRKTIQIKNGRSRSLYVDLSTKAPQKGRLYVDTNPLEAKVKILNISPVFYQGIELNPGRYNIEVSADGYETDKKWVSVGTGEEKNVVVHLRRLIADDYGKKISNSLGMEFAFIPPGSFMMGSAPSEIGGNSTEKQHHVTITKGFYMQTTEVTQGQWEAVMEFSQSHFRDCGDDCPVEQVSWKNAQEFIRKLNQREGGNKYRLPTEAEWEYACRAGSTTRFCYGDDDERLSEYAWYKFNSWGNIIKSYPRRPHPVAQKKPNAWGLYGMHGNVMEWCQDLYGDYPTGSVTDPKGPDKGDMRRVVRGGCYRYVPNACRSAKRTGLMPGYRRDVGFRLLRMQ